MWQISDQEQVVRYLIIGSEGGNFYQTPQQVSSKCASCVLRMTRTPANFKWLCDIIKQVSIEGRAAKQEPTLLSLATAIVFAPTHEAKQQALAITADCVRIPTHLYMLAGFIKIFSKAGHPNLSSAAAAVSSAVSSAATQAPGKAVVGSGFGRGIRRAFGDYFYTRKGSEIAMLLTKYQNREGWTAKDILTLIHIDQKKMKDDGGRLAIDWVFKPKEEFAEILKKANATAKAAAVARAATATVTATTDEYAKTITLLNALQEIQEIANPPPGPNPSLHHLNSIITLTQVSRVIDLINSVGLSREHLPSQFFKKREIWEALLTSKGVNGKGKGMPLTALIRNLGKLTSAEIKIIEPRISADASASDRSVYYKVQTPTKSAQKYTPTHPSYYAEMIFHRLTDQQEIRSARIHPYTILVAMLTYKKGQGDKGSLTWTPNYYILEALDFAFKLAFQNITPTGKQITIALDVSGSMSSAFCSGSPIVNCATGSVAMMMMTLWVENQHRYKMWGGGGGVDLEEEGIAATAATAATATAATATAATATAATAATAAEPQRAQLLAECVKWKITQMPDGRTLYEHTETKQCQFEKPAILMSGAQAQHSSYNPPHSPHQHSSPQHNPQHSQSAVGGRDPQHSQSVVGGRDPQRDPQHKKISVEEYRKTKRYIGMPQTAEDTATRTQNFGYSSCYSQPDHYLPELYPAPAIPSNVKICAFSNTYIDLTNAIVGYMDASINPNTGLPTMTIADALKLVEMPFSSTDCALPMVRALGKQDHVDAFVVYTDSETYMGTIHPQAALEKYRSEMGINAKLIVVGMSANSLSIADPKDLNTLNLAGFDTATPRLINDFIAYGNLMPPIQKQQHPKPKQQQQAAAGGAAAGAAGGDDNDDDEDFVVID